jgi:hypothetical protein
MNMNHTSSSTDWQTDLVVERIGYGEDSTIGSPISLQVRIATACTTCMCASCRCLVCVQVVDVCIQYGSVAFVLVAT